MRERACDVAVIGAGPAGLAAARRAAEAGARVILVDDNPAPGGQIWRALPIPSQWKAGPALRCGARAFAFPEPGCVALETADSAFELTFRALVLATGARERFLPFPGWTLPHVTGAGGLQALVKGGLPVRGKRVVVAGTGPLLLAVAHYLRSRGATVPFVAEQAPLRSLLRFALRAAADPAKLLQAARFAGIRLLPDCWPVAAQPGSVTLRRGAKTWTEPCDYLACGFGLVPNTELAALAGCRMTTAGVAAGEYQQTSIENVYAAGEITGIGGLDLALVEGEIAGWSAAGDRTAARRKFHDRNAALRFAASLANFDLRRELKDVATDDSIVCRCEDVKMSSVRRYGDSREAKLQTRCGMGPCQGRVCSPALEFLLGWKPGSVRPPSTSVRIDSLTLRAPAGAPPSED
jgi:D-hydroxyproline dehydrogenase subunit alpha